MFQNLFIAGLHDQSKSGFFRGPDFFSQSELFENLLDCSDWLDKSRPFTKPLLFWSCKQVNNNFNRAGFLSRYFSSQSKI